MCGDSLGISARLGLCGSPATLQACLAACTSRVLRHHFRVSCFNICYSDGGWQAPLSTSERTAYTCAAAVLLLFSSLVSCMMSSILGLDLDSLQSATDSPDARLRKQASRVAALRNKGSVLLTSLLIANTLVNVGLVVFTTGPLSTTRPPQQTCTQILGHQCVSCNLTRITNDQLGPCETATCTQLSSPAACLTPLCRPPSPAAVLGLLVGFLVASCLVLLFVEIAPPSICAQHSLRMAAGSAWIANSLLWLLYPVALPLSKFLDHYLDTDRGQGRRMGGSTWNGCRVFHCWDGLNGLEPVSSRDYVLDPLAIKESVEEGEGGGDGPEGNRSRSPSISSKELSHTVGFEEMDDQQRMAMAGFGTSLPRMSSLEVGNGLGDVFGSKQTVLLPSQLQPPPPAETTREVRIDMENGAGQVFAPGQGLVSWGLGGNGKKEVICRKPTPGGSDVQSICTPHPSSTLTSASKALHDYKYGQQTWAKRTSGQQGGPGAGDILPGGWGGGGEAILEDSPIIRMHAGGERGRGGQGVVPAEDVSSLGDADELLGGSAVWQRYKQAKMMAAKGGGSQTLSANESTELSRPSGPMESKERIRTGQTHPLSNDSDKEEGGVGGKGGRGLEGAGGGSTGSDVGGERVEGSRGVLVGELGTVPESETELEAGGGEAEHPPLMSSSGGGGPSASVGGSAPETLNPAPGSDADMDQLSSREAEVGGSCQLSSVSIWSSPEGTPRDSPIPAAPLPATDAASSWSSPDQSKSP